MLLLLLNKILLFIVVVGANRTSFQWCFNTEKSAKIIRGLVYNKVVGANRTSFQWCFNTEKSAKIIRGLVYNKVCD